MRHPCVYTQRIAQRQKKFKDGFVEINQNNNGIYTIIIFDEENQKIASLKTSDTPVLDGTDFQVGSYLIQIDSSSISKSQFEVQASNNTFTPSSRVMPSRPLPQKNICKESLKANKNINSSSKITKNNEFLRKLRNVPRKFDEIIAFYDVEYDPSILNKNLVQRNLKDYLES